MITCTFLGTGSAFTLKNWQTNMFLQETDPDISGFSLLIDCGSDIRFSLEEEDLSYKDIKNIYISHLHADHIGGLEYIAFCTYFDPSCGKPTLYISSALVEGLWHNSLLGGLGSIQGKIMKLTDYFNVIEVGVNGTFQVHASYTYPDFPHVRDSAAVTFRLVQVCHVMDGFALKPSFGLTFTSAHIDRTDTLNWKGEFTKVFITTDSQFTDLNSFYEDADIIIQDCETTPFKSGVHAHYEDLKNLPEKIRKKMWLCHYQDNILIDSFGLTEGYNNEGHGLFIGFATKGQSLILDKENYAYKSF
jgi:ribonuclease BN (tRNA processing enzyme)